jgi:SAM-dependent methyltransferase
MFHYSLLHEKDFHRTLWGYLAVGFSGFDLIRQLIKKYFNNTSNLKILDFAAGHGRVTRFLVNEYGPDQVYSSDIKPDAVQFHKDFFGIHSFVSSYSPEEVHCDERFSFIFAGSLFSHLPRNTFYSWLRVLGSWLKPGGILAFSVHDISMLGHDPENSGFYFHASNEDLMFPEIEGHLKDEQQYGISYVSESFVRQAIAEMIPDAHLAERIIKGFGGLQDVYVIQKN